MFLRNGCINRNPAIRLCDLFLVPLRRGSVQLGGYQARRGAVRTSPLRLSFTDSRFTGDAPPARAVPVRTLTWDYFHVNAIFSSSARPATPHSYE